MKLQHNPDPIRVVPGSRKVVSRWRCNYCDGRGRCTSYETFTFWHPENGRSETYCERHTPEALRALDATGGDDGAC